MQIIVSNNIRIQGASTPLRATITKALTMDNPVAVERKKRRQRTWGIEDKLHLYLYEGDALVVPRGFIWELDAILKAQSIDADKVVEMDQNLGQPAYFGPWNPAYELREDQKPLVAALVADNGVGVAPAGSGKTIMGMRYIYEVGRLTLWLTHTTDLMYQTRERATAALQGVGNIGMLGDSLKEWGDGKLIIATVQTLQANPRLMDALADMVGVIIIDEAHHFPATQFIDVAAKFKAARIIGLTATPDRKDQLERFMYAGIGPLRYTIAREGLYESGKLVKPEIKFVFTKFKYEQASMRDGTNVDAGGEDLDYTDLIQHLIKDQPRAELIAENIIQTYPGAGKAVIVLTESVRYCYKLMEECARYFEKSFIAYPPRMAVVHGGISRYVWRQVRGEKIALKMVADGIAVEYKKSGTRSYKVKVEQYTEAEYAAWQVTGTQRKDILAALGDKTVDILFTTQLAREGLDFAHLTVGHMATPKKGDGQDRKDGSAVEQEIGRIMRPNPTDPDKKAAWYDYVDYEVGVLQAQYYSRRKVYTRLGLAAPKKPKREVERDLIDSFLSTNMF